MMLNKKCNKKMRFILNFLDHLGKLTALHPMDRVDINYAIILILTLISSRFGGYFIPICTNEQSVST